MGGRKRQKEGFLSILGAIAKPLLVSAAGAICGELLRGTRKKIFGGKKRRRKIRTNRYRYG